MREEEVWAAIDEHRDRLAELSAGLSPAEAGTGSLCAAWTVRDVLAHLTMPLLPLRQLAGLMLRHPGGINTVIREGSRDLARRYDDAELQRRLRALVGHHRPFPGLTCREALVDVLVHTLDIALPLGRPVDLPADHLAEACDRIVSYAGRGNAKVFAVTPWADYRLIAEDHDWSVGTGPEVRGDLEALLLLVSGRTARLQDLHGPGARDLRRGSGSPG